MSNMMNNTCGGDRPGCTPATLHPVHGLFSGTANKPDTVIGRSIGETQVYELIRYASGLFGGRPLYPHWNQWLSAFCGDYPPFIECDGDATTLIACGIILLTALLAGTRDAEVIADATGYSVPYIVATTGFADSLCVWVSPIARRLRAELASGLSAAEVNATLSVLCEEYWGAIPGFANRLLVMLRARNQFGGRRDEWPEVDDVTYDAD